MWNRRRRSHGRSIIHVLADLTTQGETPGEWSARVVAAFRRFAANRVVAEINNGGEMVTEVLRQNDPTCRFEQSPLRAGNSSAPSRLQRPMNAASCFTSACSRSWRTSSAR